MESAKLTEIKKELKHAPAEDLLEMVLRLARFKKDNKELLTYMLFEQSDEDSYIASVKEKMEHEFAEISPHSFYYAKKGLRKVSRQLTKFIRYSGLKRTEVELLYHYCFLLKNAFPFLVEEHRYLQNHMNIQLRKIEKAIEKLHPDLQHDFRIQLEDL